jgi:hypothetical protein
MLPLHIAIDCDASNEIIEMLVNENPEATKVQDIPGKLPLHYALCCNEASDEIMKVSNEIIMMLLNANPDAVFLRQTRPRG